MKPILIQIMLCVSLSILTPNSYAQSSVETTSTYKANVPFIETTTVNNTANRILWQMGSYLSGYTQFSFRAFVVYDTISETGQIIEYGGQSSVFVQRPDRLVAMFDGDERHSKVLFSDSSFKMIDLDKRLYTITPTDPNIDDALDVVFDKYGITVPISDFVYSNPYKNLIENARSGYFIGIHNVDGVKAHHLVFTQDEIDWQIWIKEGPNPVPLKIVVDYKIAPGSPRYSARFTDWNFNPQISDHFFDFLPPSDASEVSVLPIQQQGGVE